MDCRFRYNGCMGVVIRRQWTQPNPGALCSQGTYEYFECSTCGYRYPPNELPDEVKQQRVVIG